MGGKEGKEMDVWARLIAPFIFFTFGELVTLSMQTNASNALSKATTAAWQHLSNSFAFYLPSCLLIYTI